MVSDADGTGPAAQDVVDLTQPEPRRASQAAPKEVEIIDLCLDSDDEPELITASNETTCQDAHTAADQRAHIDAGAPCASPAQPCGRSRAQTPTPSTAQPPAHSSPWVTVQQTAQPPEHKLAPPSRHTTAQPPAQTAAQTAQGPAQTAAEVYAGRMAQLLEHTSAAPPVQQLEVGLSTPAMPHPADAGQPTPGQPLILGAAAAAMIARLDPPTVCPGPAHAAPAEEASMAAQQSFAVLPRQQFLGESAACQAPRRFTEASVKHKWDLSSRVRSAVKHAAPPPTQSPIQQAEKPIVEQAIQQAVAHAAMGVVVSQAMQAPTQQDAEKGAQTAAQVPLRQVAGGALGQEAAVAAPVCQSSQRLLQHSDGGHQGMAGPGRQPEQVTEGSAHVLARAGAAVPGPRQGASCGVQEGPQDTLQMASQGQQPEQLVRQVEQQPSAVLPVVLTGLQRSGVQQQEQCDVGTKQGVQVTHTQQQQQQQQQANPQVRQEAMQQPQASPQVVQSSPEQQFQNLQAAEQPMQQTQVTAPVKQQSKHLPSSRQAPAVQQAVEFTAPAQAPAALTALQGTTVPQVQQQEAVKQALAVRRQVRHAQTEAVQQTSARSTPAQLEQQPQAGQQRHAAQAPEQACEQTVQPMDRELSSHDPQQENAGQSSVQRLLIVQPGGQQQIVQPVAQGQGMQSPAEGQDAQSLDPHPRTLGDCAPPARHCKAPAPHSVTVATIQKVATELLAASDVSTTSVKRLCGHVSEVLGIAMSSLVKKAVKAVVDAHVAAVVAERSRNPEPSLSFVPPNTVHPVPSTASTPKHTAVRGQVDSKPIPLPEPLPALLHNHASQTAAGEAPCRPTAAEKDQAACTCAPIRPGALDSRGAATKCAACNMHVYPDMATIPLAVAPRAAALAHSARCSGNSEAGQSRKRKQAEDDEQGLAQAPVQAHRTHTLHRSGQQGNCDAKRRIRIKLPHPASNTTAADALVSAKLMDPIVFASGPLEAERLSFMVPDPRQGPLHVPGVFVDPGALQSEQTGVLMQQQLVTQSPQRPRQHTPVGAPAGPLEGPVAMERSCVREPKMERLESMQLVKEEGEGSENGTAAAASKRDDVWQAGRTLKRGGGHVKELCRLLEGTGSHPPSTKRRNRWNGATGERTDGQTGGQDGIPSSRCDSLDLDDHSANAQPDSGTDISSARALDNAIKSLVSCIGSNPEALKLLQDLCGICQTLKTLPALPGDFGQRHNVPVWPEDRVTVVEMRRPDGQPPSLPQGCMRLLGYTLSPEVAAAWKLHVHTNRHRRYWPPVYVKGALELGPSDEVLVHHMCDKLAEHEGGPRLLRKAERDLFEKIMRQARLEGKVSATQPFITLAQLPEQLPWTAPCNVRTINSTMREGQARPGTVGQKGVFSAHTLPPMRLLGTYQGLLSTDAYIESLLKWGIPGHLSPQELRCKFEEYAVSLACTSMEDDPNELLHLAHQLRKLCMEQGHLSIGAFGFGNTAALINDYRSQPVFRFHRHQNAAAHATSPGRQSASRKGQRPARPAAQGASSDNATFAEFIVGGLPLVAILLSKRAADEHLQQMPANVEILVDYGQGYWDTAAEVGAHRDAALCVASLALEERFGKLASEAQKALDLGHPAGTADSHQKC